MLVFLRLFIFNNHLLLRCDSELICKLASVNLATLLLKLLLNVLLNILLDQAVLQSSVHHLNSVCAIQVGKVPLNVRKVVSLILHGCLKTLGILAPFKVELKSTQRVEGYILLEKCPKLTL